MTYTCPVCRHPNEGIARSALLNRVRAIFRLRPLAPECSSYSLNGFGDPVMCGCDNAAHADSVVPSVYDVADGVVDD